MSKKISSDSSDEGDNSLDFTLKPFDTYIYNKVHHTYLIH